MKCCVYFLLCLFLLYCSGYGDGEDLYEDITSNAKVSPQERPLPSPNKSTLPPPSSPAPPPPGSLALPPRSSKSLTKY